ncbi:hypothetical protein LTR37_017859 [Vermiconidia calcicola]|uniref:Uncharacterized protein n=1 Tax=Vermiconidia calcicola TaxID=1690605 RepID=A0ACC3MJL9_9PEZI|nr:hypothetical protein LTR37_017859 [Vermiconidia calcicola]
MPSLEESKRQVKERLSNGEPDHDAILASLQAEIDQHNNVKDGLRDELRKSKSRRARHDDTPHTSSDRPTKFRFKAGRDDPRETRHARRRPNRDEDDEERKHRRKRRKHEYPTPPQEHAAEIETESNEPAHPFPREPTYPLAPDQDPTDAFRTSLFDALADDEGAAAYWESVYSQPIHVYPRPSVENTATGELEQMSDAEYVDYVKRRMWEKKHPEAVFDRQRKERERRAEEEEKTREREEFVRRKEQAAWQKGQRRRFGDGSDDDDDDYKRERYAHEFTGDTNTAPSTSSARTRKQEEYRTAWSNYLSAWDELKRDLLAQRNEPSSDTSKRIPWPVLPTKTVVKANIEAFFHHIPASNSQERLKVLKAERVRWHPDKIQQRFGGAVDEGTMKLVTGVFQVVDAVLEEERKKVG